MTHRVPILPRRQLRTQPNGYLSKCCRANSETDLEPWAEMSSAAPRQLTDRSSRFAIPPLNSARFFPAFWRVRDQLVSASAYS